MFFLAGASHITRWIDDINKNLLLPMPDVTIWGEGGLPLFSKRLYDNIERNIQNGRTVWLIVPDFRFGINFFNDHADFQETGIFVTGYSMINRNMITEERDAILYQNALDILDHYVKLYGNRIKFAFWCLAVREHRNVVEKKHLDNSGHYKHPYWNYQDILNRYRENTVDK